MLLAGQQDVGHKDVATGCGVFSLRSLKRAPSAFRVNIDVGEGIGMKVVSVIYPPEEIREHLVESYKGCEFHFCKGIKNAGSLIKDMDVLITYGEDLNNQIISQASCLKWISVMSAGVEKLPFEAIREKNIMVTNARGIHAIPMAEYVIGMMLSYVKQFPTMAINKNNCKWDKRLSFGELNEKNLLVLGTGAIGSEIARLAKAFRMNTIGMNRGGSVIDSAFDDCITMNEMEEVLPNADFIVSVLPSTAETRGFLKYKHFEIMKNEAMFMNVGRGDLLSEETIREVLNNQLIGHMVLDVFPSEPLDAKSELWSYPNLTITPHISSISKKYLPRAFEIFDVNFKRFINHKNGDFVNKLDLRKGY